MVLALCVSARITYTCAEKFFSDIFVRVKTDVGMNARMDG